MRSLTETSISSVRSCSDSPLQPAQAGLLIVTERLSFTAVTSLFSVSTSDFSWSRSVVSVDSWASVLRVSVGVRTLQCERRRGKLKTHTITFYDKRLLNTGLFIDYYYVWKHWLSGYTLSEYSHKGRVFFCLLHMIPSPPNFLLVASRKQKLRAGFRRTWNNRRSRWHRSGFTDYVFLFFRIFRQTHTCRQCACNVSTARNQNILRLINLTGSLTRSLLPNRSITSTAVSLSVIKPHASTYTLLIKQDAARSRVSPWSMSLTEFTVVLRVPLTLAWICPPSKGPMSESQETGTAPLIAWQGACWGGKSNEWCLVSGYYHAHR